MVRQSRNHARPSGVAVRQLVRAVLAAAIVGVAVTAPAEPAEAAPACGPSRTDQVTTTPWPLRRLRPELVWPLSMGQGTVVAVIDSGVSPTHPALQGAVLPGKDYVDPAAAGQCDESAHGSIVAGVVAGRRVDSAFSGLAPRAQILPIRVLRDTQKSTDPAVPGYIADAIRFAADHNADVINMSLITQPTPALADAVRYALSKNVVLVAAAGNEGGGGQQGPAYPAAYDGVIGVAGVDEQDKHVSSSTSGDFVDVAAPGTGVVGPVPQGGGYAQFEAGGTSFAAAYVSGLVALLRSRDNTLSPAEVAAQITATADHPPETVNPLVGHGVINPYRAMTTLRRDGDTAAVPAQQLDRPDRATDPLGGTRRVALLIAATLGVATVVLLLAVAAVRRSRALRRG
jgi:membrane-anchored mycosin MYCP